MYYSMVAGLAFFMLFFENYDIFFKRQNNFKSKIWNSYRKLLFSVMIFYATDLGWGVMDIYKNRIYLHIDSQVYFLAMALIVCFWTQFAVEYLGKKDSFGNFIIYCGRTFFVMMAILVTTNGFARTLFWIDEKGEYHTAYPRLVMHIIQIVILIMLSIYAFTIEMKKTGNIRVRYRIIVLFGLIVSGFLTIQIWFPLIPFYTVAFMMGMCLMRTFVINGEKEEYRNKLEESLEKEKQQLVEIKSTRIAAYRDDLTGVKSKSSYAEIEEQKNLAIREGGIKEFAVAVFNLKGLKSINERFGHEKGDEAIKKACKMICLVFKHSMVFRIGGDEFVALLEGEDYDSRITLENQFNEIVDNQRGEDAVIVAMGIAEYLPDSDYTFNDTFARADKKMNERKQRLKKN